MRGCKSLPDAPLIEVYATSLDVAIKEALETFENDEYSSMRRFRGYEGFELRSVQVKPDKYYPATYCFIFAAFK